MPFRRLVLLFGQVAFKKIHQLAISRAGNESTDHLDGIDSKDGHRLNPAAPPSPSGRRQPSQHQLVP